MRVYIAAPYPERPVALSLANALLAAGMVVTSSWLRTTEEPDSHWAAQTDLRDIRRADVVLAVNPVSYHSAGTGGRHVELGYAIGLGKPVVVMGGASNVFHHLSHVTVWPWLDASAVVAALRGIERDLPRHRARARLDARAGAALEARYLDAQVRAPEHTGVRMAGLGIALSLVALLLLAAAAFIAFAHR